jgi:hypothetical protein
VGRHSRKTAVVSYADDVTVFLTSPQDVLAIRDAIRHYEQATGAKINNIKSKALAIGPWDTSINILNITYGTESKILGVRFVTSIHKTTAVNWTAIPKQIQNQAKEAYTRKLCLAKRIEYIHSYLLARAWFMAQIMPITRTLTRQINTAISWYLWKGAVFRVPLSTIQREKHEDGWSLTDMEMKCCALLYYRLDKQIRDVGTFTAEWVKKWDLPNKIENPPKILRIQRHLEYIRQYA